MEWNWSIHHGKTKKWHLQLIQRFSIERLYCKYSYSQLVSQFMTHNLWLKYNFEFRTYREQFTTLVQLDIIVSNDTFVEGKRMRKSYFLCSNIRDRHRNLEQSYLLSSNQLDENDLFCENNGLQHISIRLIFKKYWRVGHSRWVTPNNKISIPILLKMQMKELGQITNFWIEQYLKEVYQLCLYGTPSKKMRIGHGWIPTDGYSINFQKENWLISHGKMIACSINQWTIVS